MRAFMPGACVAVVALGLPAATQAAERTLAGAEIEALLKGSTVDGEATKGRSLQYFDPTGSTTYQGPGEAPSAGRWRVQGDKYCSSWPPSDGWSCYAVEADPDATPPTITFVGDSGKKYPGILVKGRKL